MDLYGLEWIQVRQDRMGSGETGWIHVGQNGLIWVRMDSGET